MTLAWTTDEKGHTGHDATTTVIINVNIDINVGRKCPIFHLHTSHSERVLRRDLTSFADACWYYQEPPVDTTRQIYKICQHELSLPPTVQTAIIREACTGNFRITYSGEVLERTTHGMEVEYNPNGQPSPKPTSLDS
ncbi:uncharacterized protein N7487_001097 [Penicillium crustosum]|uniref:uncharacterized protein n=1 Tax=Penicillium crustosum TaxID=36656 RepID=UPI002393A225|nr:uncharacterized protein N7487_001097 [Penicillium crustosum]KAJ5417547.1 hypothetical protein N7487_001097 [Penicillium crustosum]